MNNCGSEFLGLQCGGCKWWRKPLVLFNGRLIPAELAILSMELRPEEQGAWLNSRGTDSGVVDLVVSRKGAYTTKRIPLPGFVSEELRRIYNKADVKRGCPDLVIWNLATRTIRLVEVKCPHWDRPSQEQKRFLTVAASFGISAKIVEWEFRGVPA